MDEMKTLQAQVELLQAQNAVLGGAIAACLAQLPAARATVAGLISEDFAAQLLGSTATDRQIDEISVFAKTILGSPTGK